VSCSYLRNVGEQANLSATISRSKLLLAILIRSGYELPRLNERVVYLIYFSVFTATAFGLFQRASHRTLLPYKSVTVTNEVDIAEIYKGTLTDRACTGGWKTSCSLGTLRFVLCTYGSGFVCFC